MASSGMEKNAALAAGSLTGALLAGVATHPDGHDQELHAGRSAPREVRAGHPADGAGDRRRRFNIDDV